MVRGARTTTARSRVISRLTVFLRERMTVYEISFMVLSIKNAAQKCGIPLSILFDGLHHIQNDVPNHRQILRLEGELEVVGEQDL